MLNTFTSYTLIARDLPKALDRVEKDPIVDRDTKYYLQNITKVKTIDEFVKNDRLFRYAMKAHGLEDMAYAKAFMVKVLKEGITDPDAFANKLTDKRYVAFATTFNFQKYGALATSYNRAQNDVPTNFATQTQLGAVQEGVEYVDTETTYFLNTVASVKSIDDLIGDARLLKYAMSAYGLDSSTESTALVREMLEGGVQDPNSPANTPADKRYANFVTAFNFEQYGDQATSRDAARKATPTEFLAKTGLTLIKPRDEFVTAETTYYRANIAKIKSIDALMADPRLLAVAMGAFGLDSEKEDPAQVRKMLVGGVTDPNSPANKLVDKSYAGFVAAFDFAQYGDTATTRDGAQKQVPDLYVAKSPLGLVKPTAAYVKAETDYYLGNVSRLTSVDDLMADKRLLNFALSAYGLDPAKEAPARIRQMLEGGVDDPASPANKLTDKRYAAFVTAFDFTDDGENVTIATPAQRPSVDKYVRQTLEETEGKKNEGVRLALNFARKAPTITNFYEVLADKALSRVVRTALGLPDSFASADIDKQVKLFEEKLDIEDFSDPEKLGKFLQRFTSLWEIGNPTQSPQTSLSVLFSMPTEYGISTNTLLSIASLRR